MKKDPDNGPYLSVLITCLNNKALVYIDLKETGKAESVLGEALQRSRDLSFSAGIAMCLNNLGLIEIGRKAYPDALDIYLEALKINHQLKDSIAIAGTYNNIGLIHEETRSYINALHYYRQSLEISERLNYLYGISNTSLNIGKIYTLIYRFDEAEAYLTRGLQAAQKGGMLQLQQGCYLHLSELFKEKKQYHKALIAYRDYTTIKDSIFNLERSKQIPDMETKYRRRKKSGKMRFSKRT
jgi:tetratricopeptide (TPR) repeat protein